MADLGAFPAGIAKLDLKQSAYKENFKSWTDILLEFETNLENVCSEGDVASQQRHQDRGQLLGQFSSFVRISTTDRGYVLHSPRPNSTSFGS
jgi:hypothetical protein